MNSLVQVAHFYTVLLVCILVSKALQRLLVAILSPARAQGKKKKKELDD